LRAEGISTSQKTEIAKNGAVGRVGAVCHGEETNVAYQVRGKSNLVNGVVLEDRIMKGSEEPSRERGRGFELVVGVVVVEDCVVGEERGKRCMLACVELGLLKADHVKVGDGRNRAVEREVAKRVAVLEQGGSVVRGHREITTRQARRSWRFRVEKGGNGALSKVIWAGSTHLTKGQERGWEGKGLGTGKSDSPIRGNRPGKQDESEEGAGGEGKAACYPLRPGGEMRRETRDLALLLGEVGVGEAGGELEVGHSARAGSSGSSLPRTRFELSAPTTPTEG
jgi:hypothetical protein